MDIEFNEKYKSINKFEWTDIPRLAVITGPNGTGKSQLLNLIYNTIINKKGTKERVVITNENISNHEVSYSSGEWVLTNTGNVNLATLLKQYENLYKQFIENKTNTDNENQLRLHQVFKNIEQIAGKNRANITQEEFQELLPDFIIEKEDVLGQKIGQLFYDYRLSEIDLLAKGYSGEEIYKELGDKPWIVFDSILKESKLPFTFNTPENLGLRDTYKLTFYKENTDDEVNLTELSSGEKVLLSLVFHLYSTQEKNVFPRLLLLDEPDAHLHPTMTQQFINVIKNVLVDKYNVRVIMTTHSPSTVVLSPDDSLFEMYHENPRIRKSYSKNNTVSLLTSGLVYVGRGTKYLLVEDEFDSDFYSYIHSALTTELLLSGDIPLVFIPASPRNRNNSSGGKQVVLNWVDKLNSSGLDDIILGLVDRDHEPISDSKGIYTLYRYSIENYLLDPILTYAALMDKEQHFHVDGLNLKIGEEYRLKNLDSSILQNIADHVFSKLEGVIEQKFDDFNIHEDNSLTDVRFINGTILKYPNWIIRRRGKSLIGCYSDVFGGHFVNTKTLFKALKKSNFISYDFFKIFNKIKSQ